MLSASGVGVWVKRTYCRKLLQRVGGGVMKGIVLALTGVNIWADTRSQKGQSLETDRNE
jgi:hypothetical protein